MESWKPLLRTQSNETMAIHLLQMGDPAEQLQLAMLVTKMLLEKASALILEATPCLSRLMERHVTMEIQITQMGEVLHELLKMDFLAQEEKVHFQLVQQYVETQ
jgi:hypothetical protein